MFLMGMTKEGFFLGSCLSLFWALGGHFLGPLDGFQNMGGGFQDMGGDLNRGFLAGHRLKIKDDCFELSR